MRIVRTRFEFGVVLHADIEVAVAQLNGFDKSAVGRESRERQTRACDLLAVVVVELIAVAVAFADFPFAVRAEHCRVFLNNAGIRAETQSAALVDLVVLPGHKVDYVGYGAVKFARVGVFDARDVSRELNDRNLHSEADAEVGEVVFSCVLGAENHAFDAALAEAAGNDNAVKTVQLFADVLLGDILGIEPFDVDLRVLVVTGVVTRRIRSLLFLEQRLARSQRR